MNGPVVGEQVDEDERLRRWRLLLGGPAGPGLGTQLGQADQAIDGALAALYDTGSGPGQRGPGQHGPRPAGLGASAPAVARWLGDIRSYFPASVVQVMQRDAIDRLSLRQLLLEPELLQSIQPDVHLIGTLLSLTKVMPETTKATARGTWWPGWWPRWSGASPTAPGPRCPAR